MIKTWVERLNSTVSEMQIVSSLMIQQAMQEEIHELRAYLCDLPKAQADMLETIKSQRKELKAAFEQIKATA